MRTSLIAALLCATYLAVTCGCNPINDAARTIVDKERKRFVEHKAKAEQGDADAQRYLGAHYASGSGVKKDQTEAVKWLRKAADQNHAGAQHGLAQCYEGGLGVVKDDAEAARWYRKAAEQNNFQAKPKLADFYANGQGVEKDYVEAYAWHNLDAKNLSGKTNLTATMKRDNLAKEMSPEQIAAGQKRTEELRAQIAARLKSGTK